MDSSKSLLALALLATSTIAATVTITGAYAADKQSHLVSASDINWGYLNPLRGDKSPGAADLWGDRTKNTATGMLVRFKKGFSSPPHIHNISYRGVVIDGLMHNDDPSAEKMWLPTGSFWTQPAGENHITAADGQTNLIYLEIDSGPYLVQPSSEHFDNGERPINQHSSNMVWLAPTDATAVNQSNAQVTYLWGSTKIGEMGGAMIKLPAKFDGELKVTADEFRTVVIAGELDYQSKEQPSINLKPGSYVSSNGEFSHQLQTEVATTLYIRTNGSFNLNSK
ncbi:DUF4437 domain-containing protein [Shewanella sp. WXL01]|uniref:DUF4437 domain-containing protein n=1 Tax=Shewanella maritima TaxID=2520507 RepID=A0A411PH90_9GAMM|nr:MULTISPECIES: DUF4437 domain-containing protein [Shewanella]NKF49021.1 DUF4437 domain-containing protein [Shewanella sp. WXL01]QBF82834.1 DUF4437 domain-containing protein [Shewanella maritima]